MPSTNWIDGVKTVSILQIAADTGLDVGRKAVGPCPMCGARTRSGKDKRLPLRVSGPTQCYWKCYACSGQGDVVDLVAYKLTGAKVAGNENNKAVVDWFIDYGFLADSHGVYYREPPRPSEATVREHVAATEYPPQDQLQRLVDACSTPSGKALEYARSRKMDVCNEILQTPPREWAGWDGVGPWWPASWTARWSLVSCAFDSGGRLRGLHGRSVRDDSKFPKTLWHKGNASGLIFANQRALEWLRGGQAPERYLAAEGVTDFWTLCSLPATHGEAVVGYTSGGEKTVACLPAGPRLIIMNHNDKAGDDYVARMLDANPERDVMQIDWVNV